MMSDGVSGYSLYDTSSGKAVFYVLENSVVVGNGDESKDIFDDYNSGQGNSGSTVVEGGSLQVDSDNVSASDSLNDKYHQEQNPTMPSNQGPQNEVQFAGPVNSDNTALTQFVLHQNINKEVGGEGSHTFTYYDPNTGKLHTYTFRYNKLGEDLDPTASGNAYVWAPVSILRYDATEGFITNLGTAGKVTFGYGYTDLVTGLNTRFTSDITIFGNSMNLTEKILAIAAREGYVFLGWYIADDQELAAQYAAEGNFEELYKLLNTKFDGSTKLVIDGTPVSELTVYAKWGKEGTVISKYQDIYGNILSDDVITTGIVGEDYQTFAKEFEGYQLLTIVGEETGQYGENEIIVVYIYAPVIPELPGLETGSTDGWEIEPPKTGVTTSNDTSTISLILAVLFTLGSTSLVVLKK